MSMLYYVILCSTFLGYIDNCLSFELLFLCVACTFDICIKLLLTYLLTYDLVNMIDCLWLYLRCYTINFTEIEWKIYLLASRVGWAPSDEYNWMLMSLLGMIHRKFGSDTMKLCSMVQMWCTYGRHLVNMIECMRPRCYVIDVSWQ